MIRSPIEKAVTETYRALYFGLGVLGVSRALGGWGGVAVLVFLVLSIAFMFLITMRAALHSENPRWIGIFEHCFDVTLHLVCAFGLFYGSWKFLYWSQVCASFASFAALSAMLWSTWRQNGFSTVSGLLMQFQDEAKQRVNLAEAIAIGSIHEATVAKLSKKTAFLTFANGAAGLLPASLMQRTNSQHFADVLKVGDVLTVRAMRIDNLGYVCVSAGSSFETGMASSAT